MVIMYCNLVKTQAFPLVFRVSSQPRCIKPSLRFKTQSFSGGFNPKPSESFNRVKPRNLSNGFCLETVESSQVVKSRKFSSGFCRKDPVNGVIRARNFSNGSPQKAMDGESRVRARRNLPWIAGYKNKGAKNLEKVTTSGTSRSSWEESAENFFLKNGGRDSVEMDTRARTVDMPERRRGDLMEKEDTRARTVDMPERRRGVLMEKDEAWVTEENNEEVVDDPRWDRIKTRYRRMTDRETGSEKPEFRRWNKQEDWGRKTWKEATESTLPKMTGEGIYGVGPVLAALSAGRREFYALHVQEGLDLSSNNRKKKDKKGFEKVLRIAEKLGLTIKETSKHDLNMIVDNRPHQGLVLDASPLEMIKIRELELVSVEGEKGPLWVALDEVTDPQNLGAIIRSSYFFGAEGVVLCAKNSAPLSGVVSKASAGSLELMELRSCKNMMQFLSSSADNGWRVLGGSVSARALPLNEVPAGAPTILVLGSEGTGLRPLVERSCTQLIRIPGNIPVDISAVDAEDDNSGEVDRGCSGEEFRSFLAVESLNVSVAAGVLLHHLVGNNNICHLGNNQENVLD
ncbi:tRNA/rRNA methyltransferase [Macleaya cordata]|uniref:rRNA methyltransferase 1, mitochondrial n=1 Tax=Macleaya cordata TaxID=56857 RepID=A0A200QDK8_MACCD|nr:tRNA/rRNA methyltransferase [Macleaya cordata]